MCWVILCSVSASPLFAQTRPSDTEVKAAYLLNFGRFIRFSTTVEPASTFDLCVVGQDPISDVLEKTIANERLDERPVRFRRFDTPVDARTCAIVFMGQSEVGRLDKDLAALKGSDALTVSDVPHFMARGGMLEFLLQGNRVRFAISLDAVNRTNLQLGSELLRVAASVSGEPRREVPK